VAPTDECVRLLKELGAPVEYIVLPTFAYEHKIFVGPMSRRFPKAQVRRRRGGAGGWWWRQGQRAGGAAAGAPCLCPGRGLLGPLPRPLGP
jgi:hypothetical protein